MKGVYIRGNQFLKLAIVCAMQMQAGVVFAQPASMMQRSYNYVSFSSRPPVQMVDNEILLQNAGYETHPELGMLFAEAPCTDCYEVVSKRTERTKTFFKKGTNGGQLWVQASNAALHYRDKQNNWRTIQAKLAPEALPGVFSTPSSPMPVRIDTRSGYATAGMEGRQVWFNRKLELFRLAPDGRESSLGYANWSRYTAGDDGIYITEIWPGMDMEISVYRGAVKTNFYLNRPMPVYADGQLVIRDHMDMDEGLVLVGPSAREWQGGAEIKDVSGKTVYTISEAVVYEKHNPEQQDVLRYRVPQSRSLDILVPGSWLSRPEAAYPVVIDPLLADSASVTALASEYASSCTSPTGGCIYTVQVPVPPAVTVTDLFFSYRFVTDSPAFLNNGALDFRINNCGIPYYWRCDLPIVGPRSGFCYGTHVSLWNQLQNCIPPPSCASYDLPVSMRFLRCYGPEPGCIIRHVWGVEPLVVAVEGRTLELQSISGGGIICQGDSALLAGEGHYGVPPYTYTWMPGNLDGWRVAVSPDTTTRYTMVITDQCGSTTPDTSVEVRVKPRPSPPDVSVNAPICEGETLTLGRPDTLGATYQWTGPNGYSSTAADISIPDATPALSGVYYATRTVDGCTSFPDSAIVHVQPLPVIQLQADVTDICMGDVVRLETIHYPSYFYKWGPTESYVENLARPVVFARPMYSGYLNVQVTDSLVCISKDSIYIDVSPCCELYVPSAFTPNADGRNDQFRVITQGRYELDIFQIRNRWGQVVFTTTDKRQGWDGTWYGEPQDIGVYFYYVKYKCLNGVEYERKGDVTLIR
jgi:gliding motility-associated-like protein